MWESQVVRWSGTQWTTNAGSLSEQGEEKQIGSQLGTDRAAHGLQGDSTSGHAW